METSKTPKGSFTIFHVWWVLCVFLGFGWGIAFGAARFGWVGGVLGGVVGLIAGVLVGCFPYYFSFFFFSHRGRRPQKTDVDYEDGAD
jgi:hypothetical protein